VQVLPLLLLVLLEQVVPTGRAAATVPRLQEQQVGSVCG